MNFYIEYVEIIHLTKHMGLGFTLDFLGIEPNKTAGFVKYIKNIGRKILRQHFSKELSRQSEPLS